MMSLQAKRLEIGRDWSPQNLCLYPKICAPTLKSVPLPQNLCLYPKIYSSNPFEIQKTSKTFPISKKIPFLIAKYTEN